MGIVQNASVRAHKMKNAIGKSIRKIHGLVGNFGNCQQDREYYDVFLFDTESSLVYTVFKELD